jgi:DMSO/TMAO reductase YedYZ molybdopterin-dependent catalytic subunit
VKRGLFVASSIAMALAGCDRVTNSLNESAPVRAVLDSAERLDDLVIGTRGMAKLYRERDVTIDFPTNGNDTPSDPAYQRLVSDRFSTYRLRVSGLVDHPATFDLRQMHALAGLTQITRHDCVEGWSVVGKWTGVPLGAFLRLVKPQATARYVVFHSFDRDSQGTPFYGSLSLEQAAHPQAQLALALNGKPLDPDHGAPVRLRVPTQLAYKSTKWVQRIELVASLKPIGDGKGGYWEDNGYAWYAGI